MKHLKHIGVPFTFFLFSIFSHAWAQSPQPEKLKVNNNDLRGEKKIFSVANPKNNSQNLALLESGESQFLLETEGKERLKVSGNFAQEADSVFVKSFIDLKYGSPAAKTAQCPHYITLFFRGESEKVCSSDNKRVAKVEELLRTVKNKLKGR